MTNRLKLDFTLSTYPERVQFLNSYLAKITFEPNEQELETMGNYLLWGKNPATGKNAAQEKIVQIETRNKTWDRNADLESLDAILESPTFNETILRKPLEAKWKIPKTNFDRKQTLQECPESMRPFFASLFSEIDYLDLQINFWDLAHGKRKEPPRKELLAALTPEQKEKAKLSSSKWSQYTYLKKRHLLVELRRQQYSMRDCYTTYLTNHAPPHVEVPVTPPEFDSEFTVLPFGLRPNSLIFVSKTELRPDAIPEKELNQILRDYWHNRDNKTKIFFDFRDKDSVYALSHYLIDLRGVAAEDHLSTINQLLKIFDFYLEWSHIDEVQKEIWNLKVRGASNKTIVRQLREKFGKMYNENYVSTIFCQKIVPAICAAAIEHEEIVCALPFQEEFKTCTGCGAMLLRSSDNFVKKTRAKDGFSNRCKMCDKKERERRKKNGQEN